tara:strand:- start:478 stop:678 length:201 start_codon:yes stop_codon:yes gene_type:complete
MKKMKNKDFNLFNLFSKTFKDRKMFGFIGFDELGLMPKVSKPIRQTEEETLELPENYFNNLTKGEK